MKKKIKIGEILSLFDKYGDLGLKVKTPYGFNDILNCAITEKNGNVYKIKTENGLELKCSGHHGVKTKNGKFTKVEELVPGKVIQTENGNSPIISVENTGIKKDLIDIEVKDVHQYYSNGIVSHNSVIGIDLPLFLFFGTTTKTKTNADIFNKFRDENNVVVKGEIVIDGDDYIIERTLTRKLSKSDEYNVTSKLEFYKKNDDGTLQNLAGEQRRETEKFIETAIGSQEDFLATILTTGYNLEELIESKPTARGQVLMRFMGLESLRNKEEKAKEMYNDWSRKLLGNTYNIAQLEIDNATYATNIEESNKEIKRLELSVSELEKSLKDLESRRDEILSRRNTDIDNELIKTNPEVLQQTIDKLNGEIKVINDKLSLIIVKEPTNYYMESDHDKVLKQIGNLNTSIALERRDIEDKKKLIKGMTEGNVCPTCKTQLDKSDHTKEIEEINYAIDEIEKNIVKLNEESELLAKKDGEFKVLKSELEEYERTKLQKAKLELEIEQKKLLIESTDLKLTRFESNKAKFEENQKIDTELVILRTKIDTTTGTIKQSSSDIIKNKGNITSWEEKIKTNIELIGKIRREEEYGIVFKGYLGIYGKNGISKVIMKNMIPLLNQELQRLLSDSAHFILELNVNDKNEVEFIMIDTETRVVKPLNAGSGYERTISSLALRSVLTKISSLPKPNIVVMDEVFGKIADENLEMVGEFFKKIKKYFEHIVVISHNPLIRNWSDNLISIKKEDNVSVIDVITLKITENM